MRLPSRVRSKRLAHFSGARLLSKPDSSMKPRTISARSCKPIRRRAPRMPISALVYMRGKRQRTHGQRPASSGVPSPELLKDSQ